MAKENNPVKIVQVNANDHRPPPDNTSVDQKVFDGGVISFIYRDILKKQL